MEATLEGVVDSEADPGATTTAYVLAVHRVAVDGGPAVPVAGRVRMTLHQYTTLLPGDRLRVTGKLEAPPVFEGFDYRAYLERQDIVATMLFPRLEAEGVDASRWFARTTALLRSNVEDALQRALPEPEAALAAGVAFGRDETLDPVVRDAFRDAGLAHVLAVSGSNVVVVAATVMAVATSFVRRQWALVPAAVSVVAYVCLAGLEPSTVRAGVMAGIFLLGAALGRQQSGLAALGAAAILMTAIHPATAANVGFQLSLAATGGLMAFGPWIRSGLDIARQRLPLGAALPDVAVQVAAISLAATVSTLPVTWFTFERISLVGPLANIVVEPVFAVAFFASLVVGLGGLAWEPLGWAAGLAALYPLRLMRTAGETAASVPYAAVDLPRVGVDLAVVAGAALFAAALMAYRRYAPTVPPRAPRRADLAARRVAFVAAGSCCAVAVTALSLLPLRTPGELLVDVLDVGQGDAILITTPRGHRLLVDGGPSGIVLARQLGAVMPHWERRIDAVLLTHAQEDHLAGLVDALRRYNVGETFETHATNTTISYRLFEARSGQQTELAAGTSWEWDGVLFEVLWPPAGETARNRNDLSIVLRVTYGEVRLLFTGDVERGAQAQLLAAGTLGAHVVKVPHHGAATNAPGLFDAVGAQVALISAGAGNRFGHPAQETLDSLVASGARVVRTDIHGRARVRTDGRSLRVSSARASP
jgi:competence protein ComEC